MKKGFLKEYNFSKGFGFITGENKEDYFVHISGLREHLKKKGLFLGQKVFFDIDFGMKGDKAINVRTE
ncbi:MAG: cold shock domain-containing protein [Flavobacteriaceae bacterium TMED206]|nr:MAG: cold shock domain-containing protein [Flavobacteriaceae bacterium TMED206]